MTIGDLLSFVGILLAILAFLREKERSYILLKFRPIEYAMLFLVFLIILYLILFDPYFSRWELMQYFYRPNGFAANVWAFFISILVVSYLLYKITWATFPRGNTPRLMNFYNRRLLRGDEITVLEFIESNHLTDILEYLNDISSQYKNWLSEQEMKNQGSMTQRDEYYSAFNFLPVRKSKKYEMIDQLLTQIVARGTFVTNTADKSPDFYWRLLESFRFPSYAGSLIGKGYIETLLLNRHQILKRKSIEGWRIPDEAVIGNPFHNFWRLLTAPEFIKYHNICQHVQVLGEIHLNEKSTIEILNMRYDRRIHEGRLRDEMMIDMIYVLMLTGVGTIGNKLDNQWQYNNNFVQALVTFAFLIFDRIEFEEKEIHPWDYSESTYGLEMIIKITNSISYLIQRPTFESKNLEYIDILLKGNIKIIAYSLKFKCPELFQRRLFENFFHIYSFRSDGVTREEGYVSKELKRLYKLNLKNIINGKSQANATTTFQTILKREWDRAGGKWRFRNSVERSDLEQFINSL